MPKNAHGVYEYETTDTAPNTAALLNKAAAALTDLVRATPWIDLKTLAGIGAPWVQSTATPAQIKRVGNRIYLRGRMDNNTAYSSFGANGTLPDGFRTGNSIAYYSITSGSSTAVKGLRVGSNGLLEYYAATAALAWMFDGITWETSDAWPAGY